MDFIGRIKKKKAHLCKKKIKWHLKTCCLDIGFKLKKTQQSIKNLYRLYSQLHSTFSDLYMLLCA